MIRLIVVIVVGIVIAAGGAYATQTLLSGTPGGSNLYQYGVR
jgi:hypothetical protein